MSGLIDDELSKEESRTAQKLIESDPYAKTVIDNYSRIRKIFTALKSGDFEELPENFASSIMTNIDHRAPLASTAGESTYENSFDWKSRLKNPRIWVFPAIVLLIALFLNNFQPTTDIADPSGGNNTDVPVVVNPQTESGNSEIVREPPKTDNTYPERKIMPPLPDHERNIEILSPEKQLERDIESVMKSGINISCKIEPGSKPLESLLLPVFINSGLAWNKTTLGGDQVIYEIASTPKQLLSLLEQLDTESNLKTTRPDRFEKTFDSIMQDELKSNEKIKVRFSNIGN